MAVVLLAHGFKGAHQLAQTLQREKFALHRDHNGVRRAERIDGQQVERRCAVDEDVVIQRHDRCQHRAQAHLTPGHRDQLNRCARQLRVGGQHICVVLALDDGLADIIIVDQAGVGVGLDLVFCDAVGGCRVSLRVQIHDQDLFAQRRHTGAQVDGGRGLANAALLVCYCDDFCCHAVPPLFFCNFQRQRPLISIIAQWFAIKKGSNTKSTPGMFHVEHSGGRLAIKAKLQSPSGLVNSASSPIGGAFLRGLRPREKPPLTGEVAERSKAGGAALALLPSLPGDTLTRPSSGLWPPSP